MGRAQARRSNSVRGLRRPRDGADAFRRQKLGRRNGAGIHLDEAVHRGSIAVDGAEQLLHLGRRRLERRQQACELVHRHHVLVAALLVLAHGVVERTRAAERLIDRGRTCRCESADIPSPPTAAEAPQRSRAATADGWTTCVDTVSLGNVARSTIRTRYPLRAWSIAVGEPAQRAPTTITSCAALTSVPPSGYCTVCPASP